MLSRTSFLLNTYDDATHNIPLNSSFSLPHLSTYIHACRYISNPTAQQPADKPTAHSSRSTTTGNSIEFSSTHNSSTLTVVPFAPDNNLYILFCPRVQFLFNLNWGCATEDIHPLSGNYNIE